MSHANSAFPARAGMNRLRCHAASRGPSVPRTRGDEPLADNVIGALAVRSPHARG